MKKTSFILLILCILICSASVFSLSRAQGFDGITHPDNLTAEQDENVSITWEVTISSVGGNQTFNVFKDGVKIGSDLPWSLIGNKGTITINPPTNIVGTFNISITVYDGLGNSISDDVELTVTTPGGYSNIWVYVIAGGILGAIFLIMFFNRRKIAKMIERNKNLNDNPF